MLKIIKNLTKNYKAEEVSQTVEHMKKDNKRRKKKFAGLDLEI